MKPIKTLFFVLSVFMLLGASMWITPDQGVKVGPFTFHMPSFEAMFVAGHEEYADVSEILEHQFDMDSLSAMDLEALLADDTSANPIARASYDSLVKSIHKIEMLVDGQQKLERFFVALDEHHQTRVMHYGDSQLEGDRITSFVRNKLQNKFGGTGPGLRPAVQPYDYGFSAVQTNSDNWKRYPIYGKVDSTVQHQRYGVMGAFSRFAPPAPDSIPFKDSMVYEAELTIAKTNFSFFKTRQYEHLRLFYGNAKRPVDVQVLVGNELVCKGILRDNFDYGVFSCNLPDSADDVTLKFRGWDSPDIYGIELASENGVIVDNIPLRGNSGTIFTQSDYEHSTKMYRDLDPALFILQFGGNVMPYINNQKAIDNYARWFGAQIRRLQRSCPDAAFIVIGPSDMSTKEKDNYVTYPYLPAVVEALKQAAFENGSAYWDMYQAMGGHNSMPGWVNAEPALAQPDYVHFSVTGARLIGNMFYNALIYEYNNYLLRKRMLNTPKPQQTEEEISTGAPGEEKNVEAHKDTIGK